MIEETAMSTSAAVGRSRAVIGRFILFYPEKHLHTAADFYSTALGVDIDMDPYDPASTRYAGDLPNGGVFELRLASADQPTSRVQLELVVGYPELIGAQLTDAGYEVRNIAGTTIATDPGGNAVALTRGPWPPPLRTGWAEVYGRLIDTLLPVDPLLKVDSVEVVDGEMRVEVTPSNATVAQVVRMYVVAAEEETGFTCEICGNDVGGDDPPGKSPVLCADHEAEE
jgi:hypothetical protein